MVSGGTGAGHLQTIRGGADPRPRASAQKLDSWQPWPLALDRPQGCSEVIKGEAWGQVSSLNGTSMSTATHLVRAGGRVPGPGVLAGWGGDICTAVPTGFWPWLAPCPAAIAGGRG